ncbi:IclR family transcriptional regulator [Streptomyces buecherae]|uniref:IclR family transcriptional regulator n=1 Tax=Streptomyces buecherae TaxID=2763006 RepID=A0A7H8NHN2_9ACTN|nr:IclR family transcriptional regulator [Streptomyces buecherae]
MRTNPSLPAIAACGRLGAELRRRVGCRWPVGQRATRRLGRSPPPRKEADVSTSARSHTASTASSGGVQSLERAFDLLERMADAGGEVGLSELATSSGLPLPTIHRLMRTLVATGYVRQQPNRRYSLGPRLIRLGESASRLLGTWARPHLARLVEETGETANMALLDGDEVVYVAQVPSRHSMRMFTEVGRRVLPHSTGVGKALLAPVPDDEVRALLARTGMPAATEKTITTPDAFVSALETVRSAGYAVDDNEQEIGVRCLAVTVPDSPTATAISISGPAGRVTDAAKERIVPLLKEVARDLSRTLAATGPA